MSGKALMCWLGAVLCAIVGWWLGTWAWQVPMTLNSFWSVAYWGLGTCVVLALFVAGFGYLNDDDSWEPSVGWMVIVAPAVIFLIVAIVYGIATSAMFHASSYASQLGVGEATSFKESDLPAFDVTQLPWVEKSQAERLGDKTIGELGAIGSTTKLGEYVRQEIDGELYFVSPMLHRGFWAYNNSPEGTPGYVMVSMTNDDKVELKTKIGEKDIRLRCQPKAAWGDKLKRRVYNYDRTLQIAQYKFEIDDNFNPYWVMPYYRNTIGWSAAEVKGVLIVDAQTGEIKDYGLEDVPEWVDRVYPIEFIETQLDNWGKYLNGYWNCLTAKKGLMHSDTGNALVYRDGDCYLFDSLTSVGTDDDSTVGFVLVNLRNKEVRRFSLAGATERAAQGSALGDERVKAQSYNAGFPIPTMLEGQPVYFFGLQDPASRMNKMFALVNIKSHTIVGVGSTIRAAKEDYLTKYRASEQTSLSSTSANLIEIEGKIVRWGSYVVGGETLYRFVLDSALDKICVTDSSKPEAAITEKGDRVKVTLVATSDGIWSVFSFDNLELDQAKSTDEKTVEQAEIDVKLEEFKEDPNIINEDKFKEFFDALTPEQQKVFLDQVK